MRPPRSEVEPDAGGPVARLYRRLLDCYGPQGWWPLRSRAGRQGFDDRGYHPGIYCVPAGQAERLEVVVGAVLTQNTSWRNAESALGQLAARGLVNRRRLLACPEAKLAGAIRSSGYFNQKARKLRLVVEALHGMGAPPGRRELMGVWGVGPETADSILLYAYHYPTFVVDAYTRRLATRLGWIEGREPYDALQSLFASQLPRDAALYGEYHALIVHHAKQHCRSRPSCAACPLLGAHCHGVRR